MTHQPDPLSAPAPVDAGRQMAQLRQVEGLVSQIAGTGPVPQEAALDESARISAAYGAALPIIRRRFDALAAETAAWAAAGIAALLAAGRNGSPPREAAGALAEELDLALGRLARLLRA